MTMSYFVYILRSEIKETYYYGSSADPDRRLTHHNGEKKGYTQRYRPWVIVFRQKFNTKSEAEAAERVLKKWKSKKMTRLVIEGKIQLDDYL